MHRAVSRLLRSFHRALKTPTLLLSHDAAQEVRDERQGNPSIRNAAACPGFRNRAQGSVRRLQRRRARVRRSRRRSRGTRRQRRRQDVGVHVMARRPKACGPQSARRFARPGEQARPGPSRERAGPAYVCSPGITKRSGPAVGRAALRARRGSLCRGIRRLRYRAIPYCTGHGGVRDGNTRPRGVPLRSCRGKYADSRHPQGGTAGGHAAGSDCCQRSSRRGGDPGRVETGTPNRGRSTRTGSRSGAPRWRAIARPLRRLGRRRASRAGCSSPRDRRTRAARPETASNRSSPSMASSTSSGCPR